MIKTFEQNQLNEMDKMNVIGRLPRTVYDMLQGNPGKLFVAGGMIRSCIAGETINDVDLFSATKDLADKLSGELAKDKNVKRYDSPFAYTIRPTNGLCIQFIHRWTFDNPLKCVDSFDFTIAKSAIWFEDGQWKSYCHDSFYQDLAAKRLVYVSPVRDEEPGGSLLRVLKFYQKGYRIPLSSLAAVIARLNNGIRHDEVWGYEGRMKDVVMGLLFDVDTNNAEHAAYIDDRSVSNDGKDVL